MKKNNNIIYGMLFYVGTLISIPMGLNNIPLAWFIRVPITLGISLLCYCLGTTLVNKSN